MNYEDKKIVGIIASNVEPAVALNVIGHLAISIGKYSNEEIMGKPTITDKSGIEHLGISQFPFIVTKVKAGKLRNAIETAKNNPNLLVADYPRDMLETRTDNELVEAISSKENEKLEYLGALIYGDTKDVNEITGKFQLWRLD
jgi:ABC-type antimicrobial peptide transport system ATPase subunit